MVTADQSPLRVEIGDYVRIVKGSRAGSSGRIVEMRGLHQRTDGTSACYYDVNLRTGQTLVADDAFEIIQKRKKGR